MRCPFAEWRGPIPNETPGGMGAVVGVVFHIMGSSFSAADNWFHNPSAKASAHFGIKQDGALVQWVDTADKAWHAVAANSHWIGVETEGASGPLSDAGIATFGRLYAWLHEVYGVTFQITDDPVNGHGLGWHGMGGAAWGGHDYCPGPERRAQRARVIQLAQRAQPIPAPPPAPSFHPSGGGEDSRMALVTGPDKTHVDLVVVGLPVDAKGFGPVFHSSAPSVDGLLTAAFENLGGSAKSVSAGWTADGSAFVVAAHGTDDHVWIKTWDNAHQWSAWRRQTTGVLAP